MRRRNLPLTARVLLVLVLTTVAIGRSGAQAPAQESSCKERPCIRRIWPPTAALGETVSIYGANFGSPSAGSITIGGMSIAPAEWTESRVSFTLTSIPPLGRLVITTNGIRSNSVWFEYSAGMRTTRPAVYISPESLALAVGDRRALALWDAKGKVVADVKWSVDYANVATIQETPAVAQTPTGAYVIGASEGRAIVTAVSPTGTARAVCYVLAPGRLVPGVNLWDVYGDSLDDWPAEVAAAVPQRDGNPELFITEWHGAGGSSVLALTRDGSQVWRRDFDELVTDPIGGPDGGVLIRVGDRLARLSSRGRTAWIHAPGAHERAASLSGDQVIYSRPDSSRVLRAWDYATGLTRFEAPTPLVQGEFMTRCLSAEPTSTQVKSVPLPNTIVEGVSQADGDYYYVEQVHHHLFTPFCVPGTVPDADGTLGITTDTYLVQVSPHGPWAATLVRRDAETLTVDAKRIAPMSYTFKPAALWRAVPFTKVTSLGGDADHGMLLMIQHQPADDVNKEELLVRVKRGVVQYSVRAPEPGVLSGFDIATTGHTLLKNSVQGRRGRVVALDPRTAKTIWSSSEGELLSTTNEGGALLMRLDGPENKPVTTILRVDKNGLLTGEGAQFPGDATSMRPLFIFPGTILVHHPLLGTFTLLNLNEPKQP